MDESKNNLGVLDVVIFLVKNLKLLVLMPLVVGFLAYGVSLLLPRSYVSQAILDINGNSTSMSSAQAVALMVSPEVLAQTVEALHPFNIEELRGNLARQWLRDRIKVSAGKDGIIRLEVVSSSPDKSKILADTLLDVWFKNTAAKGRKRRDLETKLSFAQESLVTLKQFQDRLMRNGIDGISRKEMVGMLGMANELQIRHLDEVVKVSAELEGIPREVVQQPPSLPVEPSQPRKILIVILSTIITGFLVLLGLIAQHIWRAARHSPQMSNKQDKLLAALRSLV